MIYECITGSYDDSKVYTAWELCGDHWWIDDYDAYIIDGRSGYECATASRNDTSVRLMALRTNSIPRVVVRYVDPDQPMVLKRIR